MVCRNPLPVHRLALCLGMLCGLVTCLYGIACILLADSNVLAGKHYTLAVHHYKMAQQINGLSGSQGNEQERQLLIARSLLLSSVRVKPDHMESLLLLSKVLKDLRDDSNRQKVLQLARMLHVKPNVDSGDYEDKILSSSISQELSDQGTNYTMSMVEPLSFRFLDYGLVLDNDYASIQ